MGFHPSQESAAQLRRGCRGRSRDTTALRGASAPVQPMALLPLDLTADSAPPEIFLCLVAAAGPVVQVFFPYSDSKGGKLSFPFYELFCYVNASSIFCIEFFKQGEGIGVFCR